MKSHSDEFVQFKNKKIKTAHPGLFPNIIPNDAFYLIVLSITLNLENRLYLTLINTNSTLKNLWLLIDPDVR